jgi:hypothetical protein
MSSICTFLFYHISSKKTVYSSRSTSTEPLSLRVFSRSSSPCIAHHQTVLLPQSPSSTVLKYRGGGISLDLDLSNIFESINSALQMDLARLAKRHLSLQQTMTIANKVPFPASMLRSWDTQLSPAPRSHAALARLVVPGLHVAGDPTAQLCPSTGTHRAPAAGTAGPGQTAPGADHHCGAKEVMGYVL